MEAVSIRKMLHQYIEQGDDKLLKIMYVIAKEYTNESDEGADYSFSDADMQLLEERRKKRLSGESKTYNWDEAKNIITGKAS